MTWKRVVTAALLIPIVVGLVLYGSTAAVAVATAVIVLLALVEYFRLGDAVGHRAYRLWTATCALVLIFVQYTADVVEFFGARNGVGEVFFLFVVGIGVLTLFTKRPMVEALPSAGISSSALLLVAFPLTYAIRLHGVAQGPVLLLFALVITWVGDSVAYFVGGAFGKNPLAPHLSPKKTWEGSVASFAGSLVVAVIFRRWLNASLPLLLGMAAVGNVAGQMGDLLESAYKRSVGVKDSGGLLPGHGGVLDRIDALILTIPVVWYYWILCCAA
ncbi:MAG TPA: phosphatidate cytidylyltransferase [Candidatus Dormibacteraeota bacterium]|nr:phosphatidate cytidylyltransferase [Candidatus Dormibacteraeota bacterium]